MKKRPPQMLSKMKPEKGLLRADPPGGHRAVGRGKSFQQRVKLPQGQEVMATNSFGQEN